MSDDENKVLIPRFFKVFLSETSTESFGIPVDFMEHLPDPLPETVKLQGTGGGFWTVSLTKKRDCVYFTKGWSKFAEDHELKDGEFLTFVYDGKRNFEVSVYGRWGCKETRAEAETIELPDSDSESGSESEPESLSESESESEEDEEAFDDDPSFGENEEISQSIYPLDSEETDTEAAVVAETENVAAMTMDMTNPNFTTNLKNRLYELLIPANVVKEHNLLFGDTVTYIDVEGSLVGQRGKWSDDRICFKGWDRICRRNRLKNNDVVDCELLHNQSLVHSIRVHVRRGAA
ncbi:B3 domain-containing protein REM20 [Cardamine amara subsp. amara]|uniref:B3 domain-containing protein REM20 n=1 Tax=Cardamine amara subsp. amara TaxID=228776 RepID=A0ABD0ZMC8_CARAN